MFQLVLQESQVTISELSKALGNAAAPFDIESNGKTYHVKLVDQAVKVAFEKKLYQHAKDAVTGLRADLSSDEYIGMLTQLTQAYEAGEFAMEGTRGIKAIRSPKGALILMSLLLGVDEIETMNLAADRRDELAQALDAVIKESFPGAKIGEKPENNDPKA